MTATAAQKAAIRDTAEPLLAAFARAGAARIEAPLLLPADTLLDLYGEDIRARAYTTDDPDRGELMLRPDFTVPVTQMHLATGQPTARYAYLGEVFRKQSAGSNRPSEYLQLGFELFDGANPVGADATVFALFAEVLAGLGLRPVLGDMGIILAAIDALETTQARKTALRRHVWRPTRFRNLLMRYTHQAPAPLGRADLLARVAAEGAAAVVASAQSEAAGLRSTAEIEDRITRLVEDAAAPPIDTDQAAALSRLLALKAPLPDAVTQAQALTTALPGIAPAVARLAHRAEALQAAGQDIATLGFEASFGRTTMEYYDGFVFGFLADEALGLPPVATGGRYDALTRILGGGQASPAVGGVIRPELVHRLRAEGPA